MAAEILIKRVFKVICVIEFNRSRDKGYDAAVLAADGKVTSPNFWSKPAPFFECLPMYGDNHPWVS